jgi:menaquinone-dependent protoporphyrinogen oxidase
MRGGEIMTEFNRREFIHRGLWLGAGVAGAAGLGGALIRPGAAEAARIQFIQTRCGRPGGPGGRVLVAYASRCGSTGGVAQAIGRELCQAGAQVDVKLADKVTDVSPYRAVIVGSAVRRGRWLSEAMEFVEKHQKILANRPTAYFQTCISLSHPSDQTRRVARGYLNTVLNEFKAVKPVHLGMFAGVLDYDKISWLMRTVMRRKMEARGIKPGDYRDWAAIRAWARALTGRLALKAAAVPGPTS